MDKIILSNLVCIGQNYTIFVTFVLQIKGGLEFGQFYTSQVKKSNKLFKLIKEKQYEKVVNYDLFGLYDCVFDYRMYGFYIT